MLNSLLGKVCGSSSCVLLFQWQALGFKARLLGYFSQTLEDFDPCYKALLDWTTTKQQTFLSRVGTVDLTESSS